MTIKKQLNERSEKWIQGAIKKPGALKKSLGVPADKPIPAGKLEKATHAKGKLGQRARLAKTLKGLHEEDMEEGNAYGKAVSDAKARGDKQFSFGGKTHDVKENRHDTFDKARREKRDAEDMMYAASKGKGQGAKDTMAAARNQKRSAKDDMYAVGKGMNEAKKAKPDYLDFDGDGNKSEPMKKALADKKKKKVKESAATSAPKAPKFSVDKEKFMNRPNQKQVKETQQFDFSSLEALYETATKEIAAINEGITISTTQSSGSEGSSYGGMGSSPTNTINVSAQDEDAKQLMKILRSAGLVDGDSDSDDEHDDKGIDHVDHKHDVRGDDDVVSMPGGMLSSDDYEDEGDSGSSDDSGIAGAIEVIAPSDMSNSGSDVMKQLIAKMMGKTSEATHESTCNECGSMYEGESCMECGGMYEDQQVQEADMVGDFMNQITYDTPASDSEESANDGATVTASSDESDEAEDNYGGESSKEHDEDEFSRFLDLLRPVVGDVVDEKKDELKDVFDKVDDDAEDTGEDVADELEDEAEENNSPESKEEEYDQEEYETTSESKEEDEEEEEEDEEVDEGIEDMGQSVEDAAAEKEGEAEAQAEKLDEREYGAALAKLRESAGLPSQSTEGLANGADDTAVQDTEFMVNTISQGANQKKSTGIAIQPQNKKWPVNESMTSMRSILDKLTRLK